jgi:hypothetical protein
MTATLVWAGAAGLIAKLTAKRAQQAGNGLSLIRKDMKKLLI